MKPKTLPTLFIITLLLVSICSYSFAGSRGGRSKNAMAKSGAGFNSSEKPEFIGKMENEQNDFFSKSSNQRNTASLFEGEATSARDSNSKSIFSRQSSVETNKGFLNTESVPSQKAQAQILPVTSTTEARKPEASINTSRSIVTATKSPLKTPPSTAALPLLPSNRQPPAKVRQGVRVPRLLPSSDDPRPLSGNPRFTLPPPPFENAQPFSNLSPFTARPAAARAVPASTLSNVPRTLSRTPTPD